MPAVEMICLANSKKHGGRCVAGLRLDGQGWVRPVGVGKDGTLYPRQYRLTDGTSARVLDRLRVQLYAPHPKPHHPEDWYVSGAPWELLARPAPRDVIPLL